MAVNRKRQRIIPSAVSRAGSGVHLSNYCHNLRYPLTLAMFAPSDAPILFASFDIHYKTKREHGRRNRNIVGCIIYIWTRNLLFCFVWGFPSTAKDRIQHLPSTKTYSIWFQSYFSIKAFISFKKKTKFKQIQRDCNNLPIVSSANRWIDV